MTSLPHHVEIKQFNIEFLKPDLKGHHLHYYKYVLKINKKQTQKDFALELGK